MRGTTRISRIMSWGITVAALAAPCQAVVKNWIGHQPPIDNRNWENAANWQPAGVPAAADDVVIPGNAGDVIITNDAAAKKIKTLTMQVGTAGGGGSRITSSIAAGQGRDIEIEATGNIILEMYDKIIPGASTAQSTRGGHVALTSTTGLVRVTRNCVVAGGKGGGAGAAQVAGQGGDVTITAKTEFLNGNPIGGTVRGGDAGTGTKAPAMGTPWAHGGDVTITVAEGAVTNRSDGTGQSIRGGNGRGRGGDIRIICKDFWNRYAFGSPTVRGGNAGNGTSSRGGNIEISASHDIKNEGGTAADGVTIWQAIIRGGDGSNGLGAVNAGDAGRIMLLAANDIKNFDGGKAGWLTGGNAGAGGPVNVAGGPVVALAGKTLSAGKRIEGGLGNGVGGAGDGKPRGWVLAQGEIIDNVQKIVGNVIRLLGAAGAGGAAGGQPAAMIDLSAMPFLAIEADDLVCIDAGAGGTIKFVGAASNSIVSYGGPGSIQTAGSWGVVGSMASPLQLPLPSVMSFITSLSSPDAQFGSGCADSCPADLNDDGVVNGIDLAMLLAAWHTPGGDADLNGDGTVNSLDLAVLLGEWGPC